MTEGLRSAREAAHLAPDDPRYLLVAARAELASGHEERAKALLDRILEDRPDHPVAMALVEGRADADAGAEVTPSTDVEGAVEREPEAEAEEGAAEETELGASTETPAGSPTVDAAEPAVEVDSETKAEPEAEVEPVGQPEEAGQSEAKDDRAEAPEQPARRQAPRYDEYDQLARAAGSDEFLDGRPPVLDYESNMTRGQQELAAGNYARARAYFDSALEVHPGSAEAMDALGDVATAVSDYASALRYYRVAAQRGRPDGYFKLGQTYERLGKSEEAVSAYYTYIKRRPNGAHVAAAREAIKTLEPRAKLPPGPSEAPEPRPAQESETTTP